MSICHLQASDIGMFAHKRLLKQTLVVLLGWEAISNNCDYLYAGSGTEPVLLITAGKCTGEEVGVSMHSKGLNFPARWVWAYRHTHPSHLLL